MSTLSKGSGIFKLSDSDRYVGSLFSVSDIYKILEIDLISEEGFASALLTLGILQDSKYVDEKILYKQYSTLKDLYSSQKTQSYTSLDEYVLKQILLNALPGATVTQQYQLRLPGSTRAKKIDFKVDYDNQTKYVEFDGPSHYVPQYGSVNDSSDKKKRIEDFTGCECVIWPYWIQRCESNAKILFEPSIQGRGALWSTTKFFGDFLVPNPSQTIIEETKRFNAIRDSGVGYFYGSDESDDRVMTPHPIVSRILKGKGKVSLIIPPDWRGDPNFWLPTALWK